jgi:hypothetical protein
MGAPTTGILAEVYIHIQHVKHKQLYSILLKHKIIGYFRYVDILII